MYNAPRTLSQGIHVLSLPLSTALPIAKVFPREISGAYIEQMNDAGVFVNKCQIVYENGLFLVDKAFATLTPLQVVRLHLCRELTLFWDVNIAFKSHTRLRKEVLPFATTYSQARALYLMQLCKLVYDDEASIKRVLSDNYAFSEVFYFSKATAHQRLMSGHRFNLLYLFVKSRTTMVDLQFMKLIRYDNTLDKHVIVLVFKGSKEIEDWVTNLTASGASFMGDTNAQVHRGFQDALRLFIKTIRNSYFELDGRRYSLDEATLPMLNEQAKIIFTGHSLGGAIATLAACYFYDKGLNAENIEVYSFGAPPVASRAFVDHFRDKFAVYRVVNQLDFVPRLESINSHLFHLGEQITLPSNQQEMHTPSGYIDNLLDAIGEDESHF